MKKMEELRNYLLENYVDKYGDLALSGLDFSEFEGDVCIDNMKVKGHLYQHGHRVQGQLYQHGHEVGGHLFQKGHEVQGNLDQSYQKARGNLYNLHSQYGGELSETPSTQLLKEVTHEELASLGYKLKGGK